MIRKENYWKNIILGFGWQTHYPFTRVVLADNVDDAYFGTWQWRLFFSYKVITVIVLGFAVAVTFVLTCLCSFPVLPLTSSSSTSLSQLHSHFVTSVRIRRFSGPYFPAFGLNTKRYGVSLRIPSEYEKIWSGKTPNTGTFHPVSQTSFLFELVCVFCTFFDTFFLTTESIQIKILKLFINVDYLVLTNWYTSKKSGKRFSYFFPKHY